MKGMLLEKPVLIQGALSLRVEGRGNPLILKEIEKPEPSRSEVLIKISACGVCHTDLHIVEGELPPKISPIIPGHEVIGKVEKTGPGVSKLKKGDHVGIPWLYSTCRKCEFCKGGKENLCENAKFTGWHVNGGYAEYMIGLEDFTYKLPKFPQAKDDYHIAPLMCAGVVGYRAYRLSEIQKGGKLALFGFGASAHVIIQIAVHHGCDVYVFTRSGAHKKHAEKLGAKWVGSPKGEPPHKMDGSIIFAPAGEIVPEALRVTKKGGVVANSSIYMSDIPSMNYEKHLYYEKKLLSVANSTREDVVDCLNECAKAGVMTDVKVFSFKEANRALSMLKDSQIDGAAVLSFN